MTSHPALYVHVFRVALENDAHAILRVLGPFAVAGLIPRRLAAEISGQEIRVEAEFDNLDDPRADWLCHRLRALPVVRSAEHRALATTT